MGKRACVGFLAPTRVALLRLLRPGRRVHRQTTASAGALVGAATPIGAASAMGARTAVAAAATTAALPGKADGAQPAQPLARPRPPLRDPEGRRRRFERCTAPRLSGECARGGILRNGRC